MTAWYWWEICSRWLHLASTSILLPYKILPKISIFFIPACVGRFGTNCSQSCPQGYYGRRCSQTCSCNITLCDNVLGCSEAASGKWVWIRCRVESNTYLKDIKWIIYRFGRKREIIVRTVSTACVVWSSNRHICDDDNNFESYLRVRKNFLIVQMKF